MALVLADRVQVTTSTTGTGTLTLGSAVTGFQDFTVIGDGNTTYYTITNSTAWEVGVGTYTSSGTTLARTTILSNSNGNTSPITLSGDSNVFVTYPAVAASDAATELRPIGATVASNAITVTLGISTVAFRSTTLTSGALAVLQNAATLSLVIAATDSFGAVTADGVRRIVILAINNAGTIELAASSLAGGVNLDETGVITTATAATTLTAIKAAAVRTGVAYRIVGFIDVPFTTSVGWGSLAVVQPIGGQALAAMSSLGYGQTWQVVTRTSGVTYYNLTGKPLSVNRLTPGSVAGTTSSAVVINGGTSFTFAKAHSSSGNQSSAGGFVVPIGARYVITDTNGLWPTTNELR